MNSIKKILYGLIKKNRHLPQEFYARIFYEYYHGEKLDLKNPKNFAEKIQWLKVYYHLPILNQFVDKYAVRSYVKEKIGEGYLNEIYAVYDHPNQVDYDKLPEQFVLKGTHGSNMNIIVKSKKGLNKNRNKLRMFKWMSKNLYYAGGQEWAYKDVTHRIIAEKYLDPKAGELLDYKIHCFSGTAKFIQVDSVFENVKTNTCYDLDWNKMELKQNGRNVNPGIIERPDKLEEMIEIANKLADSHPFVRVDLYNLDGKIIFGELTLYPRDARIKYEPEAYDKIIGSYINLPKIPSGAKEITSVS